MIFYYSLNLFNERLKQKKRRFTSGVLGSAKADLAASRRRHLRSLLRLSYG